MLRVAFFLSMMGVSAAWLFGVTCSSPSFGMNRRTNIAAASSRRKRVVIEGWLFLIPPHCNLRQDHTKLLLIFVPNIVMAVRCV